MSTLTVTQDTDYSSGILFNIDAITFNVDAGEPNATATFSAGSFGSGVLNNVLITSDAKQNIIIVDMPTTGTFSAAGWQFSNWTSPDFVAINGTSGADIITGPSSPGATVILRGGGGADILYAGSSGALFEYVASGDIKAGEQLIGSAQTDAIRVFSSPNGTNYNLSLVEMTSINALSMTFGTLDGIARVTLSGNQVGAGGITTITDAASLHDALTVKGASVDMSGVTIAGWTNGDDSLMIVGTKLANTLIGSTEDDDIIGGRGKDHLTGGGNDDTFIFNSKADSLKGAAHRDVIHDFTQGSDLIDLHLIDAKSAKAGNQTFHFIGAMAFHHKAGELRVSFNDAADLAVVSGDTNGDGKADFQIAVQTPVALLATDFVL
jgi:Ca2+-binding RTX toxin-like protein